MKRFKSYQGFLLILSFAFYLLIQLSSGYGSTAAIDESGKILESDKKARLTFIDLLISQTNFARAGSLLKIHLSLEPADYQARLKLADLLSWQRDFAESLRQFKIIIATRPKDAHLRRKYAQVLLWSEKKSEAIVEFTSSQNLQNEHNSIVPETMQISRPAASLQLGKLLMDFPGREEDARKWLLEALSDSSARPEALFLLGMLALRDQQNIGALAFFQQAVQAAPQNPEYRLWLARCSVWNKKYSEGITIFNELWDQRQASETVLVDMGQAWFWSGDFEKALHWLDEAQGQGVHNLALFETRGEVLMALSCFTQAIEAFAAAELLLEKESKISASGDSKSPKNRLRKNKALCLSYTDQNVVAEPLLQSFYKDFPSDLTVAVGLSQCLRKNRKIDAARKLLLDLLTQHPHDANLLMEAGDIELDAGHWHKTLNFYEEALKEYQATTPPTANLRWANRLVQMGDFPRAIAIQKKHLSSSPEDLPVRRDMAWALASMERYEEAEGELLQILSQSSNNLLALSTFAQLKLLENKFPEAEGLAKKVLLLDHGNETGMQVLYRIAANASEANSIVDIDGRKVIADLREKLSRDPDNFPDRISLALELANEKQYSESLAVLNELEAMYPDNYQICLSRARILAWSRNFSEAFCRYKALCEKFPDNPVPYKEGGRTAFWAKNSRQAHAWYEPVMHPAVDDILRGALNSLKADDGILPNGLLLLEPARNIPGYKRFEAFSNWYKLERAVLSSQTASLIDQQLLLLHARYLLQRNFFLERKGKELVSQKKPRRALRVFKELLKTAPGNLEILTDQSQIYCSLGLQDSERQTYNDILCFSPQYSLVRHAIEKLDDDERPGLRFHSSHYREEGRGDLSRMRVSSTMLEGEANLNPRWRLSLSGGNRVYRPGIWNGTFRSRLSELKLRGAFSAETRLNAGISRNDFSENRLFPQTSPHDRTSGFISLNQVIRDSMELNLGYERAEAVTNDVALREGTQADHLWLGLKAPLSKRLSIAGRAQSSRYSDGNTSREFFWSAEYDLTDFPEIFRLIVSGDFRDTDRVTRYAFLNGRLADIHYPYWTPENYRSQTLALQYYRDFSHIKIARADHHYLSLIMSSGNDSIHNPSRRLDWSWHLDWNKRWEVNLEGFWQDSAEWDASQINFMLEHRF